ncbi:hypothetical protein O77CONTIG1_00594 [Leptolyngbya sp. O-77]|nr:HepT-like ribonuclease domain-containing protein [Leptolyngbya sp. O-77]BAU40788.1 hypothetical protein O77CONTIG1_00594 [Leptolyngbya sp. O-77]
MSSRPGDLRIQDILGAIASIQARTAGMSPEAFEASDTVYKTVLYDFVIIGEASANVPLELQQKYPEIPWRLCKTCETSWLMNSFGLIYRLPGERWSEACRRWCRSSKRCWSRK